MSNATLRAWPSTDTVMVGIVRTAANKRKELLLLGDVTRWLCVKTHVQPLTVFAVEGLVQNHPVRQMGPTLGPDPQVVVGVRPQVQTQVAVCTRSQLTLGGVQPTAVQEGQLKLSVHTEREKREGNAGFSND